MIETFEWKGPQDSARARQFFAQHIRGVKSLTDTVAPGVRPKYAGDPGLPGGQPILVVVCGDGVTRYCTTTVRWLFDGHKFTAERIEVPA